MKPMIRSFQLFIVTLMLTCINVLSYAQETSGAGGGSSSTTSSTKVEITSNPGNWFTNNWIWVVGVVVFIILLLALIGGGSSRRRTTVVREDSLGNVSRTTTVDDDL